MAFVSIRKNIIKNLYAIKEKYLEEILIKIQKENIITYSIVSSQYKEVYERSGFKLGKNQDYKNFVTIYMEVNTTAVIE